MAFYGAASLTGGWLGMPPWWQHDLTINVVGEYRLDVPLAGREWISGAVVAAGLAIVAVGAWPQRRTGVTS